MRRGRRESQDGRVAHGPNLREDQLAQKLADGLLEPIGYASWQTPYIRAAGDLMFVVGACEAHLTSVDAKKYTGGPMAEGRFPIAVEAKARAYFAKQRQSGHDSAAELDLDKAGCSRALLNNNNDLATAR